MHEARNGVTLLDRDRQPVGERSAAEMRVPLVRAARVYEAAIMRGEHPEETVEVEAGAILIEEQAVDLHRVAASWDAWLEAHKKS